MNEVVIVSAARTPVGNFGGSLRTVPAYDLGALVLDEVVRRAKLGADLVDMVIMGQNYQSGEYVNIARMSLLKAGWPVEIPALTMDRRCPSGFDAICLASMMIQTGNADIVVAGGAESMSTAMLAVSGSRFRRRATWYPSISGIIISRMMRWGFTSRAFSNPARPS